MLYKNYLAPEGTLILNDKNKIQCYIVFFLINPNQCTFFAANSTATSPCWSHHQCLFVKGHLKEHILKFCMQNIGISWFVLHGEVSYGTYVVIKYCYFITWYCHTRPMTHAGHTGNWSITERNNFRRNWGTFTAILVCKLVSFP